MTTYIIYAISAPKMQECQYEIEAHTMYEAVNSFYEQFGMTALTASDQYPKVTKIVAK